MASVAGSRRNCPDSRKPPLMSRDCSWGNEGSAAASWSNDRRVPPSNESVRRLGQLRAMPLRDSVVKRGEWERSSAVRAGASSRNRSSAPSAMGEWQRLSVVSWRRGDGAEEEGQKTWERGIDSVKEWRERDCSWETIGCSTGSEARSGRWESERSRRSGQAMARRKRAGGLSRRRKSRAMEGREDEKTAREASREVGVVTRDRRWSAGSRAPSETSCREWLCRRASPNRGSWRCRYSSSRR